MNWLCIGVMGLVFGSVILYKKRACVRRCKAKIKK